jgi:hypothetical protein
MKAVKKYKDGGKNRKPISKKKAIRNMRSFSRKNEDGGESTHLMAWYGDPDKKRGDFSVAPTIAPKEGNTGSSDPKDWEEIDYRQAKERGEVIDVKSRKKAEKLSFGSWKKGKDKRDAMREYRGWKKSMKKSKR